MIQLSGKFEVPFQNWSFHNHVFKPVSRNGQLCYCMNLKYQAVQTPQNIKTVIERPGYLFKAFVENLR